MNTPHASAVAGNGAQAPEGRSLALIIWAFVLLVFGLFAFNSTFGPTTARTINPAVSGAPRPVEFSFGSDFIVQMQWGTVGMMVLIIAVCWWAWRRQPGHPYVLMTIAATGIVWQDPIMNWAPYAVYNPQLWHLPETWWLAKLSPTVEPWVVIGYASFYFIVPFFAGTWVLRKWQARSTVDAFVWRHPLITLGALILVIGFVFDAMLEIFSIRAGLYIYSQVIPWGSFNAGDTFQFPLIWESVMVTFVMIPAGVLCYRDDTGRTQAEKLAQQFRLFRSRPTLATFLVMFLFLNIGYFAYGAGFGTIRASGLATSVACPWPYPEVKIYDPQGYYEREGHPGPFFDGYWNTWMTGHDGRPTNNPVKPDAKCKPDAG
jgi:hypothetical protein